MFPDYCGRGIIEMEISEDLLCLFNAELVESQDSYVIEVPESEVQVGPLQQQSAYRVAMLPAQTTSETASHEGNKREQGSSEPPVKEGEELPVEIEDIGDQGDGIARVGPGYVVIVSDAELGDRVTVKITETRDNVAFADIVEGPY